MSAGFIGPGIYPSFVLVFIIIIAMVIIIKELLKPKSIKIISPYELGQKKANIVQKIGDIISTELEKSVDIEIKSGEGYFSAMNYGFRAKNDGDTLTIISNDKATFPNFVGSSIALEKYEPAVRFYQDPNIFILKKNKGSSNDFKADNAKINEIFSSKKVGFPYPSEIPYFLKESLDLKCKSELQGIFFKGTQQLVKALEKGMIEAGFCLLSDIDDILSMNKSFFEYFEIIAITSSERVTRLRHIPTFKELGVDVVSGQWIGLGCPKGTKKTFLNKLYSIIVKQNNLEKLDVERKNLLNPKSFKEFLSEQKELLDELKVNIPIPLNKSKNIFANLYQLIGVILTFIAFVVSLQFIDFLIASFIFLSLTISILWSGSIKKSFFFILLFSGIVSASLFLLFTNFFYVNFP